MTEHTDEQFAAAYDHWLVSATPAGNAVQGRAMFKALKAHCPELFAKPQGLNLLQEVTLRLTVAQLQGGGDFGDETMKDLAVKILALGDAK